MSKTNEPWREAPNADQSKMLLAGIYSLIDDNRKDNIPCHCPLSVNARVLAVKMIPDTDPEMTLSLMLGVALEEIKRLQSLMEHG